MDWVVQVDCPDSVDSYIHRVGRTARYESGAPKGSESMPAVDGGRVGAMSTYNWGYNWGYNPLTKWDEPPSRLLSDLHGLMNPA